MHIRLCVEEVKHVKFDVQCAALDPHHFQSTRVFPHFYALRNYKILQFSNSTVKSLLRELKPDHRYVLVCKLDISERCG